MCERSRERSTTLYTGKSGLIVQFFCIPMFSNLAIMFNQVKLGFTGLNSEGELGYAGV
jgi:hypothetical protein